MQTRPTYYYPKSSGRATNMEIHPNTTRISRLGYGGVDPTICYKKNIFENGLAFSDRDERVTQSTKSWKLHKVTHIINFILKENVKV